MKMGWRSGGHFPTLCQYLMITWRRRPWNAQFTARVLPRMALLPLIIFWSSSSSMVPMTQYWCVSGQGKAIWFLTLLLPCLLLQYYTFYYFTICFSFCLLVERERENSVKMLQFRINYVNEKLSCKWEAYHLKIWINSDTGTWLHEVLSSSVR